MVAVVVKDALYFLNIDIDRGQMNKVKEYIFLIFDIGMAIRTHETYIPYDHLHTAAPFPILAILYLLLFSFDNQNKNI